MSRVRALSLGILLAADALFEAAGAEPGSRCGPFRAEWNRGVLSPTAGKLEGFIYNQSPCSVSAVRIRVVAVSDAGQPLGETLGWVHGDIPAGVISFDEVSRRP